MSFSFSIAAARPPVFERLHDALVQDLGEAVMWESTPEEPWPEDFYCHSYLWGISTRAVEMSWLGDSFQVRIMTCSCRQDYELGLRAVELVAEWSDASIEPESGMIMTASQLRTEFGDEWVASMVDSGATVIPRMLESGTVAGPLTLPGPERDFVIGERVLAELAGPKETFADRLFAKIREVRYFDPAGDYFRANRVELTPDDGDPVTFAVWGPEVRYVLPDVKLIAVPVQPTIFIPLDVVPELAGEACRRLDERQLVLEALEGERWDALVEAARSHAVDI